MIRLIVCPRSRRQCWSRRDGHGGSHIQYVHPDALDQEKTNVSTDAWHIGNQVANMFGSKSRQEQRSHQQRQVLRGEAAHNDRNDVVQSGKEHLLVEYNAARLRLADDVLARQRMIHNPEPLYTTSTLE